MAAAHTWKAGLVRIITWQDGQRQTLEFRSSRIDIEATPPVMDTIDVTSMFGPAASITGLVLEPARLVVRAEQSPTPDHRSTLEQRLADAVLEGDDVAAYGLADDLLERRARPEGFVEREELRWRLAAAEVELAAAEAELERLREVAELMANAATRTMTGDDVGDSSPRRAFFDPGMLMVHPED